MIALRMVGAVAVLLVGVCHAQAPIQTPAPIPVTTPDDSSALSGKMPSQPVAVTIPVGSVVQVKILDAVDSGSNKNGDTVQGVLSAPVTTGKGRMLPSGSKVEATVVSAAKAGTMQSAGVLSLQLTRVGGVAVVSDVVGFTGQKGHRDVADSNPEKGTEAKVQTGAALIFHVMESGPVTGLDLPGAAKARSASPAAAKPPPR